MSSGMSTSPLSPISGGREILHRKMPEPSQVPPSNHHHNQLCQSVNSVDDLSMVHRGSEDRGGSATKDRGGGGGGAWSKHAPINSNVIGQLKNSASTGAGALSALTSKETTTLINQQNKSAKHPDSKLVVLGSPAVGKSECSYRHCGLVDDEPTCIEILDSAGQLIDHQQQQQQQDHPAVAMSNVLRWGEGFLLVYSITDRVSFEEVSRLHCVVCEGRRAPPPTAAMAPLSGSSSISSFVLVGNKSDLSHERQVSYAEGEQLATDLGCSAFFECSACEPNHHLYEAFYELHRDVVRRRSIVSSQLNRRRRSSAHQVIQVFNKMFTKING